MTSGWRSVFAAAGFAALALLGACRSPNPSLYTIAVVPGPAVPANRKTIELRDIALAGYLDRPQIVRSSDGVRLEVTSNDTWGESLGGMIGRVMAVELAQRLPGSNVYGERSAISFNPDATVAINIQRMDIGQDSQLILMAQVAIEFTRRREPVAKTFRITQPVPPLVTTADEVTAISTAIGQLADGVAQMLH